MSKDVCLFYSRTRKLNIYSPSSFSCQQAFKCVQATRCSILHLLIETFQNCITFGVKVNEKSVKIENSFENHSKRPRNKK